MLRLDRGSYIVAPETVPGPRRRAPPRLGFPALETQREVALPALAVPAIAVAAITPSVGEPDPYLCGDLRNAGALYKAYKDAFDAQKPADERLGSDYKSAAFKKAYEPFDLAYHNACTALPPDALTLLLGTMPMTAPGAAALVEFALDSDDPGPDNWQTDALRNAAKALRSIVVQS